MADCHLDRRKKIDSRTANWQVLRVDHTFAFLCAVRYRRRNLTREAYACALRRPLGIHVLIFFQGLFACIDFASRRPRR